MNTRAFLTIGVVIVAVILVGLAIYNSLVVTAVFNLNISPTDATITVDGGGAKPGNIKLTPGKHTIVAKRDGFKSETFTVDLKGGQPFTKNLALDPANDQAYAKWRAEHPDEVAKFEGVAGAEINEQGTIITQDNPLIELLPYRGADYSIDFGVSKKHTDDPHAVGIYIRTNTEAAKTRALNWIKAQGYDPAAYEIIYESN